MILILLLLALSGLFLAELVNYLADVLPVTRRFSRPACRKCGTPFSTGRYILMRNCVSCGRSRSVRSFAVLLLGIPVAFGAWYVWSVHPRVPLVLSLALLTYLAVVFVIDVEHHAILHETSYFGAALGLIIGTYIWSIPQDKTVVQGLINSLLGGAVGFGIMYAFYLLGELFAHWIASRRGEPSDEVALGFGDVNLTGILGLILGPVLIVRGVFFAILASGVVSLVIVLVALSRKRYHAFMAIPYAPFLILGAVLTIYVLPLYGS
jgi:prepilin signal peptidase PulO-like enzyme (type II secretory pathway)